MAPEVKDTALISAFTTEWFEVQGVIVKIIVVRVCVCIGLTLTLVGYTRAEEERRVAETKPAQPSTTPSVAKKQAKAEKPATPLDELKALAEEYLVGCELKSVDVEGTTVYRVVDQQGKLAHNVPGWQMLKGLTKADTKPDTNYMGNPSLNDLLRKRRPRVTSSEDAVKVVRLVLGLTHGLGRLGSMWEYSATRMTGGWLVQSKYVGPPAMVSDLDTFEIFVNAKSEFLEMREPQPTR